MTCHSDQGKPILSGTSCFQCDATCLTCSDLGPNACTSCDNSKRRFQTGDSCSECSEASGRYLSAQAVCLACDSPCATCDGPGSNNCLSCSDSRYFAKDLVCVSCAVDDDPSCPKETTVEIPKDLEEQTRNLTITFKPSLKSQLPEDFELSADTLLEKHFELKIDAADSRQIALTFVEKNLTHTETGSELFIKFLEKLRVKKVKSVSIRVPDPWIFQTPADDPEPKVVYIKSKGPKQVEIVEKELDASEAAAGAAAAAGKAAASAMAGLATIVISVVQAVTGGSYTPIILMVQFFGVLELVSNIANINVELGPRIKTLLAFTENIKIPEFGILKRLSPLDDRDEEGADANAYQLRLRGTRGKMTGSNEDIFIASGQNFIYSIMVVVFWAVKGVMECTMSYNNRYLAVASAVYQTLMGLVFFDFQLICANEISMFDYSKIRQTPWRFVLSMLLSMLTMVQIVYEYHQAMVIIKRSGDQIQADLDREEEEAERKKKEERAKRRQKIIDKLVAKKRAKNGGLRNEKKVEEIEEKETGKGPKDVPEGKNEDKSKNIIKNDENEPKNDQNQEPKKLDSKTEKDEKKEEKVQPMARVVPNHRLIFQKYTEAIIYTEKKYKGTNYLMVYDSIRFFIIQIIIGTLQLLSRTQAALALLVNFVYYIYFIKTIATNSVFKSKFIAIKTIFQESCMLIVMATMTLFTFTQNTKFVKSPIYSTIEIFTLLGILGAAGAEFLVLASELLGSIKDWCKKDDLGEIDSARLNKVLPKGVLDGGVETAGSKGNLDENDGKRVKIEEISKKRAANHRAEEKTPSQTYFGQRANLKQVGSKLVNLDAKGRPEVQIRVKKEPVDPVNISNEEEKEMSPKKEEEKEISEICLTGQSEKVEFVEPKPEDSGIGPHMWGAKDVDPKPKITKNSSRNLMSSPRKMLGRIISNKRPKPKTNALRFQKASLFSRKPPETKQGSRREGRSSKSMLPRVRIGSRSIMRERSDKNII